MAPVLHAKLSPSSAHRWMVCPGSVWLSKDAPSESSPYAEEGTRAHARAEDIISSMIRGVQEPDVIEDFPELGTYIKYARGLMDAGYELFVEVRVPLIGVTGERAYGTSDLVAVKGADLKVVDLKWGQGVPVSAEDNIQLSIYALAAMDLMPFLGPFKTVELVIVQPRVASANDGIDAWETTVEHLEEQRKVILADAKVAREQLQGLTAPTFCPSKKACRWCRAAGICAAYANMVADAVGVDFPAIKEDEPTLEDKTRAELFKRLDDVRAWVEQFESAILEDALNGKKFPGLKLVLGRAGARKWTDEQTADDMLTGMSLDADAIYKRKLITPTEAEKLYKAGLITDDGWASLCKQMTRSEPKPVLVSDSDKRTEYKPVDAGKHFSDVSKA